MKITLKPISILSDIVQYGDEPKPWEDKKKVKLNTNERMSKRVVDRAGVNRSQQGEETNVA
jgi:hypothetical protein